MNRPTIPVSRLQQRFYSRLFPRTCHRHRNEYHRIVVNVTILIVRGVDEVESVICLGHRYSGNKRES